MSVKPLKKLRLNKKEIFNLVETIIDNLSTNVLGLTRASKILTVDTPTDPFLDILSEFKKVSITASSEDTLQNNYNYDFTFIFYLEPNGSLDHLLSGLPKSEKICCLTGTEIIHDFEYRKSLAKENIFIDTILLLPKCDFTSLEVCLVFFERKKKTRELVMQVEGGESLEFQLQKMEDVIFEEWRSVESQNSIADEVDDLAEYFSAEDYDQFSDHYTIEYEEENIPTSIFSNKEEAIKFAEEKEITQYKIHKENAYENLWEGKYFPVGAFKTTRHFAIQEHIDSLVLNYDNYNKYTLGEISESINIAEKNSSGFPKCDNSIYIPLKKGILEVGKNKKEISIERDDLKLKDHYICQVVLNPDIIINEYASIFINSGIGQQHLGILYNFKKENGNLKNLFSEIDEIEISNFPILVPDIKSQSQICETDRQIKGTLEVLKKIQVDLQQEPLNEKSIERVKLISESALSALETEIIAKDLRRSENKNVEFKQTLSWDTRTGKKNPALELEVIKNICAFANVEGGRLYIGVHDNGEALGTDEELKKLYGNSQDKFKLKLTDLLKESIVGNDYIELLDYRFSTEYNNIPLFIITVKKGKAIWHKNGNLYIRENPRTRGLIGKEASDYANSRQ
jgi:hypothetical protein